MGRVINSEGNESTFILECQIQNLIRNSNDLTVSGNRSGEWDQMAGFTSVAKNQTGPDGTANSANELVGGGSNALVLRQSLSGAGVNEYDHFCISLWMRRRAGTKDIRFDIGDGSTPASRVLDFPLNDVWYFRWVVLEAGGSSWLDFNFVNGSGDATIDIANFQMNEGSIPFLYTETTSSVQDRDNTKRSVRVSDLWRIGNEEY